MVSISTSVLSLPFAVNFRFLMSVLLLICHYFHEIKIAMSLPMKKKIILASLHSWTELLGPRDVDSQMYRHRLPEVSENVL